MNPPSLKQSASDFVALLNSQNIKALFPYAASSAAAPGALDLATAGVTGGISGFIGNTPAGIPSGQLNSSVDNLKLNHASTSMVNDDDDAAGPSSTACELEEDSVFLPNPVTAVVTQHDSLGKTPSPTPANSPYHATSLPIGEGENKGIQVKNGVNRQRGVVGKGNFSLSKRIGLGENATMNLCLLIFADSSLIPPLTNRPVATFLCGDAYSQDPTVSLTSPSLSSFVFRSF